MSTIERFRIVGGSSISEFSVVKYFDSSTPILLFRTSLELSSCSVGCSSLAVSGPFVLSAVKLFEFVAVYSVANDYIWRLFSRDGSFNKEALGLDFLGAGVIIGIEKLY